MVCLDKPFFASRQPLADTLRARAIVALAMVVGALGLSACHPSGAASGTPAASAPVSFHAVDITGADYAKDLALLDGDGHTRHLADWRGKVVFVFFGFTQCPQVCPTTMAMLAQVRHQLGGDGSKLQGVFVSVDPQRDTPAVLKAYLGAMDPSFVGLTGSEAQIDATAREFKVFYQKVPTGPGVNNYTIDHSAGAYVFDPQGHVRLFVRYGETAEELTQDIRHLLG